tara:strand:- start:313 stop:1149 length:837 start_codon:yes stop_codon:yes gene_type:complete
MGRLIVTKKDFIRTYKSRKYANEAISKYGHLLPIKSSEKLAEVAAQLLTDGSVHIKPRYNSRHYSWVAFYSKNVDEMLQFERLIIDLFDIKGSIRDMGIRKIGIRYGYFIINAFLTRVISLCGVPGGDKVKNEYKVPDWILQGNNQIQAAFLRKSFDCEGSIGYSKQRKRWEIRYSMYKLFDIEDNCKDYLNQLIDMLNKFDIYSIIIKKEKYVRKRDNKLVQGFSIRIDKDVSVLNYSKYIGFNSRKKKNRLNEAVNDIHEKKMSPLRFELRTFIAY